MNTSGEFFVEVAVSLPVLGTYSYRVPQAMGSPPLVGTRVLVPFGAREVPAFVLGPAAVAPEAAARLREIIDFIDESPAFDEQGLEFLRWVSRYYHATMGEVIRTALPSALGGTPPLRVSLTALGRSAASMPGAERLLEVLAASARGELDARWLRREAGVSMARLLRAREEGHVALTRPAPEGLEAARRTERAAVFLMQVPLRANAERARDVLALIAREREVLVSALREQFGDVSAQLRSLEARGAIRVETRRVYRTPNGAFIDTGEAAAADPPPLTPGQRAAVSAVERGLGKGYQGFLLYGVTGSGKTEVYLRLIAQASAAGLGAIVLVPEIALTPQLVGRFRARFGERIAVLHSGLSDGERFDQWEQVREGRLTIVVGARSAVFAPVARLGLLVVDEEHEPTFKQEDQLRYNARDLALVRGRLLGATVVLGSATPSLESAYNARQRKLELLRIPDRVHARAMPEVELVDMRKQSALDPEGLLSPRLFAALQENLASGGQSLLFLNRRGYASFLLCRSCGHVAECPQCSISLTYHHGSRRLVCHYCDHQRPVPAHCPKCHGTLVQPVGFGTEKVEETLGALLPSARILRMDRDTTRGRNLGEILRAVRAGDVDILVGTQMVAKGHDFPNVTLVGALFADQGLKFPDFRAAERTFQLLTQVAGRAGRGERVGRVLVQTYDPRHYSLGYARHHDYDGFLDEELRRRRLRGYPPFVYLALLRIQANDRETAREESEMAARVLRTGMPAERLEILGPSPAPIERIKGRHRWQVLARAASRRDLHEALAVLRKALEGRRRGSASVVIDVDPMNLL